MSKLYSTKEVAAMLGIRPDRLNRALWLNQVTAPEKGPGGSYYWTPGDIERAGWQLLHRQVTIPAESEATDAK